jgi:nitrite reductase/ring-hydroxylating ferredoxin subunit
LQAAEDAVLAAPSGVREPVIEGFRQYVGIVEDGDRKIVINSMCQHIDGWETSYIEVMDGGSCFWNAIYNVDTGEIESLIVNGEA